MTFTEVVVSAVILGISSQVSLQGWSSTSQAAATSVMADQQLRLLEQRLLASRRALASAHVADADCRWDPEAVAGVFQGLPDNVELSSKWQFDATGSGLWLVVQLIDHAPGVPSRRSQLVTPAGLGHCQQDINNDH